VHMAGPRLRATAAAADPTELEGLRQQNTELLRQLEAQRQELERLRHAKPIVTSSPDAGCAAPRPPSRPTTADMMTSCSSLPSHACDVATSCDLAPGVLCRTSAPFAHNGPSFPGVSTSPLSGADTHLDLTGRSRAAPTLTSTAKPSTIPSGLPFSWKTAPEPEPWPTPADSSSDDDSAGVPRRRTFEVLEITAGGGGAHTADRKAAVLQRLQQRDSARRGPTPPQKPAASIPLKSNTLAAVHAVPEGTKAAAHVPLKFNTPAAVPVPAAPEGTKAEAARMGSDGRPRARPPPRATSLPRSTGGSTTEGSAPTGTPRGNVQVIRNALKHVCLAGRVNELTLFEVTHALGQVPGADSAKFVLLVRDAHQPTYRALYIWLTAERLTKLCGSGPKVLSPLIVSDYLKYDFGGKRFLPVPARYFDTAIDAVVQTQSNVNPRPPVP